MYLGYDTITKQCLKDLVSNKEQVMRDWTNHYVNVSTTYVWPHGYANFPCSVRNDKIMENTNIEIKTLSFDDVTIAGVSGLTLDVRARFVKPDKTVITKDLTSIDLLSKFSVSMLKDKTKNVTCFVVDKKINIGEAKGVVLFQIGVKFRAGISVTPELVVIYAIG